MLRSFHIRDAEIQSPEYLLFSNLVLCCQPMSESTPSSQSPCVLVTGGAVRLGEAISRTFADAGFRVALHYQRSAAEAQSLLDELGGSPQHAAFAADLTSETACSELVGGVVESMGRIDVLVNNAAVYHRQTLAETSEESLLAELRPNLFAPLHLTRAFAAATESGCIINMLDRRVSGLDTHCLPYLLSKKALADLTRVTALELAPRIRVNAVAPGAVLPAPGDSEAAMYAHAGPIPLGREARGTPQDITAAALFLAQQSSITGQTLFVDGGQHLLGNELP